MEVGIACKWLRVLRKGWDEGAPCEDFISRQWWWCISGCVFGGRGVGVGEGALTFEIKLLDAFQRLVDKVETSESLKRKNEICKIGHKYFFLQIQFSHSIWILNSIKSFQK